MLQQTPFFSIAKYINSLRIFQPCMFGKTNKQTNRTKQNKGKQKTTQNVQQLKENNSKNVR